jgi:hypothetical protein
MCRAATHRTPDTLRWLIDVSQNDAPGWSNVVQIETLRWSGGIVQVDTRRCIPPVHSVASEAFGHIGGLHSDKIIAFLAIQDDVFIDVCFAVYLLRILENIKNESSVQEQMGKWGSALGFHWQGFLDA